MSSGHLFKSIHRIRNQVGAQPQLASDLERVESGEGPESDGQVETGSPRLGLVETGL